MAAGDDRKLSSPFDAMLDRDRERLERLYGGPARAPEPSAAKAEPSAPIRPPRAARDPSPASTERPAGRSRGIVGSVDGIPFSIRSDDES